MLRIPTRIEEVAVGDVLLEPVYDLQGQLLLEEGMSISHAALSRLAEEGVVRLQIQPGAGNLVVQQFCSQYALSECQECGTGMALRSPRICGTSKPYRCQGCQAIYFGAFDDQCSGAFCGPERVYCDREGCSHIQEVKLPVPESLTHFRASCLTELTKVFTPDKYEGSERRSAERKSLEVCVLAIPLNESYRVVGAPRLVSTRDISTKGIGLVSQGGIEADACVIDFQATGSKDLRFIANVVWEARRGDVARTGLSLCSRIDPRVGDLTELVGLMDG